jgi:hypothetical protein
MATYPSTGAKTCWVTHLDGVVGCRWGCLAFNLKFEVRISSVRFFEPRRGTKKFLAASTFRPGESQPLGSIG